jgi:hypothetical protein
LHQTGFIYEFEGNIFYGFLFLIQHSVQQHRLEVYIGLIKSYRLKFQFNGTILYGDSLVNHFDIGYSEIQSRIHSSVVLAKDSGYTNRSLFNGDE